MSVSPTGLHVYAHTHVCALNYEGNYYVVTRIGAHMCAHTCDYIEHVHVHVGLTRVHVHTCYYIEG